MKTSKIDILMIVLISLSAFAIFVGVLFKLEHWIYGDEILMSGLVASFVFSGIEIWRLKKIISKSKEK